LFAKVNGKDVLKEAIAAGGGTDLARITGVCSAFFLRSMP